MGLDISTLRNATLIKEVAVGNLTDEDYELVDEDYEHVSIIYPAYEGLRLDGKPEGIYRGDPGISFRAGSYGGYNAFREELSRLALGAEPRTVWNNLEAYEGRPCFEIVHFSDCEGAIGPDTSAKLAADFKALTEKAEVALDAYYVGTFNNFKQAFEEAAGNGFVIFH